MKATAYLPNLSAAEAVVFAISAVALCTMLATPRALSFQRSSSDEPEVVFTGSVLKDVRRQVLVVPEAPDSRLKRNNLAFDPSRRYVAFTVEDPKHTHGFFDRIFFTDTQAKQTFEIQNLPLPYRPFDSLRFIRPGVLQFDRWAGPHTGVRYRLDVRRRELVSARSFIEADYLELQKKSKNQRQ